MKTQYIRLYLLLILLIVSTIVITLKSIKIIDIIENKMTIGCEYLNCTYVTVQNENTSGCYYNFTVNNIQKSCFYRDTFSFDRTCPHNNTECFMETGAVCPTAGKTCINYNSVQEKNIAITLIYVVISIIISIFASWIAYEFTELFCNSRYLYEEIPEPDIKDIPNKVPQNVSCAICLEDFGPMNKYYECSNCKNNFHFDCLTIWIKKSAKDKCPVCTLIVDKILYVNNAQIIN